MADMICFEEKMAKRLVSCMRFVLMKSQSSDQALLDDLTTYVASYSQRFQRLSAYKQGDLEGDNLGLYFKLLHQAFAYLLCGYYEKLTSVRENECSQVMAKYLLAYQHCPELLLQHSKKTNDKTEEIQASVQVHLPASDHQISTMKSGLGETIKVGVQSLCGEDQAEAGLASELKAVLAYARSADEADGFVLVQEAQGPSGGGMFASAPEKHSSASTVEQDGFVVVGAGAASKP
jgi:hypothetical protein